MRTDRKCAVELNCAEKNRRNRSHFNQSRSIKSSCSKGDKKLLEFYIYILYWKNEWADSAPNFRHFDEVVFNVRIHSQPFFFLSFFSIFFYISSFLSVLLFASFICCLSFCTLRKGLCTIVFLCFVALVSAFP